MIVKLLKYKGIIFDDWAENEDGSIWAEMCAECAEQYKNILTNELDDGGTARGSCSVYGCNHTGEDNETAHYYVDFNMEYVEFIEEEDNILECCSVSTKY